MAKCRPCKLEGCETGTVLSSTIQMQRVEMLTASRLLPETCKMSRTSLADTLMQRQSYLR